MQAVDAEDDLDPDSPIGDRGVLGQNRELALAVATLKPDRLHINWLEGLVDRR